MFLKQKSGNITLELLIFFLLISTASWLAVGIFEASKTRNTLEEISYLAARQIAISKSKKIDWQSQSFKNTLEKTHNLKNLNLEISCENNLCDNGNLINVAASAKSNNGVFSFRLTSRSIAVSNRFSSD